MKIKIKVNNQESISKCFLYNYMSMLYSGFFYGSNPTRLSKDEDNNSVSGTFKNISASASIYSNGIVISSASTKETILQYLITSKQSASFFTYGTTSVSLETGKITISRSFTSLDDDMKVGSIGLLCSNKVMFAMDVLPTITTNIDTGNIVTYSYVFESGNGWTNNFINALGSVFKNSTESFKDFEGESRSLNFTNGAYFKVNALADENKYGLLLGSNNTEFSNDDYSVTPIDIDVSVTAKSIGYDSTNNSSYIRIIRTFTNNGTVNMYPSEVGLFMDAGGYNVLAYRHIFNRLTIIPGAIVTIYLTIYTNTENTNNYGTILQVNINDGIDSISYVYDIYTKEWRKFTGITAYDSKPLTGGSDLNNYNLIMANANIVNMYPVEDAGYTSETAYITKDFDVYESDFESVTVDFDGTSAGLTATVTNNTFTGSNKDVVTNRTIYPAKKAYLKQGSFGQKLLLNITNAEKIRNYIIDYKEKRNRR